MNKTEASCKTIEERVRHLLCAPFTLRELVNDMNKGDATRNEVCDCLLGIADRLENDFKWLRKFV